MNKFKQDIEVALNNKKELQNRVIEFSDKLIKVTKLNKDDIANALINEIVWELQDYWITVRSLFLGEWRHVLIAIPKEMGTVDIGYSNIHCKHPSPDRWFFQADGTATIIFPYEEEQKNILKQVKEYRNNSK